MRAGRFIATSKAFPLPRVGRRPFNTTVEPSPVITSFRGRGYGVSSPDELVGYHDGDVLVRQ